jgi:hypothetical protein
MVWAAAAIAILSVMLGLVGGGPWGASCMRHAGQSTDRKKAKKRHLTEGMTHKTLTDLTILVVTFHLDPASRSFKIILCVLSGSPVLVLAQGT